MRKTILLTALLALTLMACAPAASPARQFTQPAGIAPLPAATAATAAPPAAELRSADQANEQKQLTANAPITDRMIVRTISMGLEVQDTEKAFNDISAIVTQSKGYVAQTNLLRNSKNRLYGTVTVRVPAESLDAAVKQIKAAGLRVLSENSNANDVTDQYSDLNAQLKNLEATEVELRKLLETVREKSGKADEILAVYNRLTQIRQQIEQIKGRMNVLEKTSTLATVTISLTPKEDVEVIDPDQWLPDRTSREALRALVQALQGLGNLVIWTLLFFLPVILVFLIPLVLLALVLRALWRRRAPRVSSAP